MLYIKSVFVLRVSVGSFFTLMTEWQFVAIVGAVILLVQFVILSSVRHKKGGEQAQVISSQLDQLMLTTNLLREQLQQVRDFQGETHNQLVRNNEQQFADLRMKLLRQSHEHHSTQLTASNQAAQQQQQIISDFRDKLLEQLQQISKSNRDELAKSMLSNSEQLNARIKELTENTDKRLQDISAQVEKRLADGFEKTTQTFNDILKRLALIDDAQKKITELSSNVVSLQEVLADKRSRGAFGEVQLNSLIRNVLPERHFAIQHKLSNGKIADCILFLPEPTGNVVIDSKFPLESYRKMTDTEATDTERMQARRQFKQDINKHVNDISSKYLIEGETADGAVMFIPAEAVFAELHAHFPETVEFAYSKRVWLASPTTLMAILTTARSVLKDEQTRNQVHIIQEHLGLLAGDFNRFKSRFNDLARHIDQAASDVKKIHTSADKISARFEKIEQAEIDEPEKIALEKNSL